MGKGFLMLKKMALFIVFVAVLRFLLLSFETSPDSGNTPLLSVSTMPQAEPEPGRDDSLVDLDFSLGFSLGTDLTFLGHDRVWEVAEKARAKAAPAPERKYETRWVKATAYCPCAKCCGRMSGLTKIERNAWKSGVAVDPRKIPLYSRLDIPGYPRNEGKNILADDTGSKVKGWHIDVRFQYHWEAAQWGVKYIEVKIYKP